MKTTLNKIKEQKPSSYIHEKLLPIKHTLEYSGLEAALQVFNTVDGYKYILLNFARFCGSQNIEKVKPYCSSRRNYSLILKWLETGDESIVTDAQEIAHRVVEISPSYPIDHAANSLVWATRVYLEGITYNNLAELAAAAARESRESRASEAYDKALESKPLEEIHSGVYSKVAREASEKAREKAREEQKDYLLKAIKNAEWFNNLKSGSKIRIVSSTYFPTYDTRSTIGTEATVEKVCWNDELVTANTTAGLWAYHISDVEVVDDEDNA